MDEPFGALDHQTRELMQDLLLGIWEAEAKTVLFVTHDIDEAVFMGSRAVVMSARPGRIKLDRVVPLPHPRHYSVKTSPQFVELKAELTEAVREEVRARRRRRDALKAPRSQAHRQLALQRQRTRGSSGLRPVCGTVRRRWWSNRWVAGTQRGRWPRHRWQGRGCGAAGGAAGGAGDRRAPDRWRRRVGQRCRAPRFHGPGRRAPPRRAAPASGRRWRCAAGCRRAARARTRAPASRPAHRGTRRTAGRHRWRRALPGQAGRGRTRRGARRLERVSRAFGSARRALYSNAVNSSASCCGMSTITSWLVGSLVSFQPGLPSTCAAK